MRTVKISDEMFEQLKALVVDPFDDTPDLVIGRLIEIVNKAKSRWSPLDAYEGPEVVQKPPKQELPQQEFPQPQLVEEEDQVVLL